MKLTSTLFTLASTLAITKAQTTTSFDSAQWSSASSRALASDGTFIMDVLLDLNTRYTTVIEYMNDNGMEFPAAIANYMNRMPAVSDTDQLLSVIQANSFPFTDFYTMMTAFPWYTSLLEVADATTFYMPEYFLTGDAATAAASEATSSAESSFSSYVNATSSSSAQSTTIIASTVAISTSSASNSTSSTGSSSSSTAGAASLYVPMFALPALLGSMLF